MQNKRFMQNVTIITLGVLICCLSVVYAIYGTDVNITGSVKVEEANWDIHFANVIQSNKTNIESTKITPPNLSADNTVLTFGAELAQVGDIYEFTADVVNDGTFDAKISDVILTSTYSDDNAQPISNQGTITGLKYTSSYLQYTVTYNDGNQIKVDDILSAGASRKVKVRVEYKQPTESEDLPDAEEAYEFKLNISYIQNQ